MKIAIINGPNLNLLGKREPTIYGNKSFDDYFLELKGEFKESELSYFQSNVEGEIIDAIHHYFEKGYEGIILNAGAYTHTSIAIRDAISSVSITTIEVHISNVLSRESFRHESIIGSACKGGIFGLGLDGYRLALMHHLNS